jgi:hypothetical protein
LQKRFENAIIYVLLLSPIIFIAYPLLKPGVIIGGDFPFVDTSAYNFKIPWTWHEYGSHSSLETIARWPVVALWYILFNFLNVAPEIINKLLVILGFLTASISFYFAGRLFFKDKTANHDDMKLKLSIAVGSLFYTYNVWSFHKVGPWYFWIGYTLLPLFFVCLIYCFKRPRKWRYILVTVLTWSIASTTPHFTLFFGIIFIAICSFFLLSNYHKKQKLIEGGISVLLIISIYALINFYWIYPYILASRVETVAPPTVVTQESTQILSRDSNFLNVFRLIQDWARPVLVGHDVAPVSTSVLFHSWLSASFLVPILAFSSLLLKKNNKYVLIFSLVAVLGIFLSMGTQAPLNLYPVLLSYIPSSINWAFREPDKWSFTIALAYSFLISIASFEILKLFQRLKHKNVIAGGFMIWVLGSIALCSYPIYSASMGKILGPPVIMPTDINRINDYLRNVNTDKVALFPPVTGHPTFWSNGHPIADLLYQMASIKPNVSPAYPRTANYYAYLVNSIIISNKTNNINNFIYPLGTSYLIYHNDVLNYSKNNDILNRLSSLQGIKNINNVGFFKTFKADNNTGQFNIPKQNIGIVGGLDKFTSLNSITPFSSINSSLFFLDDNTLRGKYNYVTKAADSLILGRNSNDLALSFVDDKYIIKPFDMATHQDPSSWWSRGGALDPLMGPFHPYLDRLAVENWDFDYGKGLVLTWGNDKLDIPLQVGSDGYYDLYIRYLRSEAGGELKTYLDKELVRDIITKDQLNKFSWENIGTLNLTKGKHLLTLENVGGFNSVNVFALLPKSEASRLIEDARSLSNKVTNIYLLETRSDFHSTGKYNGLHLFFGGINGTFSNKFTGQFKVPKNTDFMSLQFKIRQHSIPSSYVVRNLEVRPVFQNDQGWTPIFTSPFENAQEEQVKWINKDKINLLPSLEVKKPISGSSSLKVDIGQSDRTTWSGISTNFIPISGDNYYKYRLDMYTTDVSKLYSQLIYFDSNKKSINVPVQGRLLFHGDGTMQQTTFSHTAFAPIGAKYVKLFILVKANPEKASSYVMDNVRVEEFTAPLGYNNIYNTTENKNPHAQNVIVNKAFLKSDIKSGDTKEWQIVKSGAFPVQDDLLYNYSMTVEARNANSLSVLATYLTDDLKQSYGNNNQVLRLAGHSSISTELDISKPSDYTIALRVNTCGTCTFLTIQMGNKTQDISLRNNENSQLKWVYFSTYLQQGENNIKIFSDSATELDSVIMYSTDKKQESLQAIFSPKGSPPAEIIEYKKIDPTRYVVKVNAISPYILAFAESYDPLWIAHIDNNIRLNSMPLYSLINGFYSNKTGEYTLSLQYEPQKWFYDGASISIITLIMITTMLAISKLVLRHQQKIFTRLYVGIKGSLVLIMRSLKSANQKAGTRK